MRPVGSDGLTFSSVRAITLPDTLMTLSSLHGFGGLERVGVGREHDLRHAVVIAQVDEQQLAVIALAVDPAGQPDVLPDMLGPQLVVLVRAVSVLSVILSSEAQRSAVPALSSDVSGASLMNDAACAPGIVSFVFVATFRTSRCRRRLRRCPRIAMNLAFR